MALNKLQSSFKITAKRKKVLKYQMLNNDKSDNM